MKARSDFSLIAIDNMQEMQNFLKDFYAEVKALNLGQGYILLYQIESFVKLMINTPATLINKH